MPLQYQTMNPYSKIQQGLVQGMQLGTMMGKRDRGRKDGPSDIMVKSPDLPELVTARDVIKGMNGDIDIYTKYEKETKNKSPDERFAVYSDLLSSGAIKTDFVKAAMANGIEPKRLDEMYTKIQKGDPTAKADLRSLSQDLGPENSAGNKAIANIKNTITTVNDKKIKVYADSLYKHLKEVDKVKEDPRKYQYKGQAHPETVQSIQKQGENMEKLFRADKSLYDKYIAESRTKERVGRQPKITHRIDAEGRLGTFINGKFKDDPEYSNLEFKMTGSQSISNADTIAMMMGNLQTKHKALTGTPKGGKPLPKSLSDKFVKKYGAVKGKQILQRQGYDLNNILMDK